MPRTPVSAAAPLDEVQRQSLLRVQRAFGQHLRALRHERSMTLEQVAEGADLHPNYVGSVERGERNISLFNIWRLAHSLKIDASQLLSALPAPKAR
jgi:transcriptional regulator with XRE-family HTH domain